MNFDVRHYVPCLRWKMGEYQAITRLNDESKNLITPLIEVPEIGFDFAKGRPAKSLDDHLAPFAERVRKKWEKRSCFVDLNLIDPSKRMSNGDHPLRSVFDNLRIENCEVIPVTSPDRTPSYQMAVQQTLSQDRRGLCIRLTIEAAGKADAKNSIDALLEKIGPEVKECNLVLDLGAPPNFEPIEGFAKLTEAIVRKIPYLSRWRTFTIIGTSFPPSMSEIEQGSTMIPRLEWMLYKILARSLAQDGLRVPTFGDYAISHTDILPRDMRLLKPSATIRYTADDSWFIVKGKNVRDYKFEQYRDLCRTVMESPHFMGPGFSWGDEYIEKCAAGSASTGNLTTWRGVGTNRHIEKVVFDIASYFDS